MQVKKGGSISPKFNTKKTITMIKNNYYSFTIMLESLKKITFQVLVPQKIYPSIKSWLFLWQIYCLGTMWFFHCPKSSSFISYQIGNVFTGKISRLKKKSVSKMYLVCSTKSGRLAVVWWVYNTTAATQEIKKGIHDGTWHTDTKR